MTLDQENVAFEYTKLENATWSGPDDTAPVETFDGESLIPLASGHFSPFMGTLFLAKDFGKFRTHQSFRLHASRVHWPSIEKMHTHYQREQWDFFENEARALGYEGDLSTKRERALALAQNNHQYGILFAGPDQNPIRHVLSRISLAESTSFTDATQIVADFKDTGRAKSILHELFQIRRRWVEFVPLLLPIYNAFYWDPDKHSLDEYTIAQKRFEDLKPFFVDCFETLSRISAVGAALEGVIALSKACIPTKKAHMSINDFFCMPNGSKTDVLKNLPIADLFVPFMDSHLRNGLGHHAARYDVSKDVIQYVNENRKSKHSYVLPYVRFCEKNVRIYAALEVVSSYVNWLFLRGLNDH